MDGGVDVVSFSLLFLSVLAVFGILLDILWIIRRQCLIRDAMVQNVLVAFQIRFYRS